MSDMSEHSTTGPVYSDLSLGDGIHLDVVIHPCDETVVRLVHNPYTLAHMPFAEFARLARR